MNFIRTVIWLLLLAGGVVIGMHAIRRDIRYDKEYPGDLRSRVVGARLLKDGRLPYFYKWKESDGMRYYEPNNFDSLTISNITASPVFLHLLSPVCEWPQAVFSRTWMWLYYVVLALVTGLCMFIAKEPRQKQAVLLFAILFLLTNAWKKNVVNGQIYIWIPFATALFYTLLRRGTHWGWGLLAGLVAATLVGVRINTLLFFLPFLLLLRRYPLRWWLAFSIAPLLMAGWITLSSFERQAWLDYAAIIHEQTLASQGVPRPHQQNPPDPYSRWEGIDKASANALLRVEQDITYSENGNVFVIYRRLFHRQLPLTALGTAGIVVLLALSGLFYFRHRPFRQLNLESLTIFGFCLYMVSDLFSPIYRHQYYTIQWIFPLLLATATLRGSRRLPFWLLLTAILLSCFHLPFLKMQNTIAEYGILLILLSLTLGFSDQTTPNPHPASFPKSQ